MIKYIGVCVCVVCVSPILKAFHFPPILSFSQSKTAGMNRIVKFYAVLILVRKNKCLN